MNEDTEEHKLPHKCEYFTHTKKINGIPVNLIKLELICNEDSCDGKQEYNPDKHSFLWSGAHYKRKKDGTKEFHEYDIYRKRFR